MSICAAVRPLLRGLLTGLLALVGVTAVRPAYAADPQLTGILIGTGGALGNSSNTKEMAVDGNPDTYFEAPVADGAWVGLDLGNGPGGKITQVRYYPRGEWADFMVGGAFQGANAANFSDAVTLFTITSPPVEGAMTAQAISLTNRFRYVRYVGADDSYCNVAEVALFGQAPPAPPAGFTATPGSNQVVLSWGATAGVTNYYAKRATFTGGPYTLIKTTTGTSYTDTAVTNGTTYFYVLSATNSYGMGGNSPEVSATPRAVVYLVNCGGPATNAYAADDFFSGGKTTSTTAAVVLSAAASPAPATVYQTERYTNTNFNYTFSNLTANASYKTRLHFAELWAKAINSCRFNVAINSTLVLSNLDLFAVTGAQTNALVREFNATASSDGRIVVAFTSLVSYAQVSGIEIIQGGTTGAPAAPTNLTATAATGQVALRWAASSGATNYNIKRAVAGGGVYTNIAMVTQTNYTDTAVLNGKTYYYLVSALNTSQEGPDSAPVLARPRTFQPFGVYRELWTGLSAVPGNSLSALTNTIYNPNWPASPNDAYTKTLLTFEAETSSGLTYYGQRLRTFVVPPTNGYYTFWLASDDTSRLYLSSDESPGNKSAIAWVSSSVGARVWTSQTNQQSAPVYLESGCRYYLEALMQQGTGGDNLCVRWQLPGGGYEVPLTATGTVGTVLVPCTGVDSLPSLYQQSTDLAITEGQSAVFSVLVTNQAPVAYQWLLNGDNLAGSGAIKPVYTVTNTPLALNGQVFSCVLSNAAGVVTSAPATLVVLVDTAAPTVARLFNIGTTNVQVVFSSPVEAAGATNLANYVFTNGLAITSATLAADHTTVTLITAPLVYGDRYALLINGISDLAAAPNTIAPNTLAGFQASPYAPQDIGSPPFSTSMEVVSNGVDVTAGGTDIGGTADQFGFSYQSRTGNFDVSVRLAGLDLSDVWAKAGLMARGSLAAGSTFAAVFGTPAMNGSFFESRSSVNGQTANAGTAPPNDPNVWLRLTRVGDVFTGYASYDGQTWTRLSSATLVMSSQIYVGLAVSSHNAAQTTTAQFRDIAENTGAVILGTVSNPHEPLGPSSRKTPIVISEIMYKPAARADDNNVEFVELYNTNPWFHDIGGYQLVGDSMSHTFPAGTIIQGGAFLVVGASPAGLQNVYGSAGNLSAYTGSLKKSGTLQLLDERGNVLLTVPYSNLAPWPQGAQGTGHSIVLARPSYGEGDPRAWDLSDVAGGSPGRMDAYRPGPLRNVVINEFLAHTDPPDFDYIELYNHSTQSVDISGCILTDDPTTNKFVIPPGTFLPAGGFVAYVGTNLNFDLSKIGETIYFKNPDQSRVLDAVTFEGQENGVAMGRWPDGASQFYRLGSKTPGASNAPVRLNDIVINELMYNPISGFDDDQYVELFNRGSNTVDLSGWIISDGISFTFPPNTLLAPQGYLVVGRNATRLRSNYSNLGMASCLGDFGGTLSHNGERVALAMPHYDCVTNGNQIVSNLAMYITLNEVTYGTGGRWGQWSAGGGSSLELIDPNTNNRLAANWADSDDTAKSAWTDISTTAVLDNGANYDPFIAYAQIGLLDVGECLVDNIEVRAGTGGANLVANPDFESGTTNVMFQGCHSRSSMETSGYSSGHALHIRCSDRIWTGDNSCELALNTTTNTLVSGQTATLRFKARWLHGWPEALLRLNGNWLEATGALPVPTNLGTPGQPNSRLVANAGPAIYEVTHTPSLPAASQAAVVTARAHAAQGLTNLTLFYRVDPATQYTAVPMTDDGAGGDMLAGDGLFSATIPGQSANKVVAFYVAAADSLGAATRFPALVNDNAPVRECVVLFGDGNPSGSFGVYHLWITQTNVNRWSSLSDLSNESSDCTMVNGNRVIYNMQARFAGSPFHQGFNTPSGNLCHYKWTFPDDDKFLGATSFNKIHQPGNSAGDDPTIQREQVAHMFLRALGVPWLNRRYIAVYVNGNRRGTLMEDAQCPDGDVVKEHWPNDADGWLYKMQPWFEFGPAPTGYTIPFANKSWCTLQRFTTTGGVKKTARYRYNFLVRRTPVSANDFRPVFALVDAASTTGSVNYAANMQSLADMENWMRVLAANHAAGNWDCFAVQNGQNLYGYMGAQGTKYSLLMWDFNISIGNGGSWGPGSNIFTTSSLDAYTGYIYRDPTFRRMYFRALAELVNGPLNVANSGPLIDAKYAAFAANGQSVTEPGIIKTWLSQAHDSIAAQLTASNIDATFSVSPGVAVNNDLATLTGTAPVGVKTVLFNGIAWPVTWTSLTGWTARVVMAPGSNVFGVVGLDMKGQLVPGASNNVTALNNAAVVSPVGQVVINEIMYYPAVTNAEYVELFNNSTNVTFDLSNWEFRGLSYTFPPGSLLGPRSFLVLAADRLAFATAYGSTNLVFDTFSGSLQLDGETLALVQPGTNAASDLVVAKVKYASEAPWPAGAYGLGSALQLIDPRQDNWRVGNWAGSYPPLALSPGATNSVWTNLPPFQTLWLNELQADNLSGITNRAGQNTAWLELYNPGTNQVSLKGLYLANNYTNLTQWSFPTNAVINPGEFKVIFADGQTNLSTLAELHTSFSLPGGAGALALSRLTNSLVQVLDYITYTNLDPNHSFGSFPDGQSFTRQDFFFATPAGTNNGTSAPLTVCINEWLAGNTHTRVNPIGGKYDDCFELYNYGTNAANLAGYYLTHVLSNRFEYLIPSGYVIPPHGFLCVWADKKTPTGSGDLHVSFKLSKTGTSIGLFGADGTPVDAVTFGAQASDISQGRFPDGSANSYFMTSPSVGTNNTLTLPTITITAPVATASETGPTNGLFSVARTGDTNFPVTVTYQIGGTAANGVDYLALGSSVVLPAGNTASNVVIVPILDNLAEGPETVVLTLQSNATAYAIGSPGSATVIIKDTRVDDWRFNKFFTYANDQLVGGLTATPAGDGIPNLLKYALNLDPLTVATGDLPGGTVTNGFLTLTYTKSKAATDVTCVVEVTDALTGIWSSAAADVDQFWRTVDNGDTLTITARDKVNAANAACRFMRLKVTKP